MKKRSKFGSTAIIFALTLVLGAYAYFFEFRKGKEDEERKRQDAVVLKIDKSQISRLEFKRATGSVVVEKIDGGWMITEPVRDLADKVKMDTLVNAISGEASSEVVAENAEVNLATYGLDKPVTSLLVKSTSGETAEIKIGSIKSFDAKLYAQIGNENRVLLVNPSWDVHLSVPLVALRDKNLVRMDELTPDQISISTAGQPKVELKKTGEKWQLVSGGDPKIAIDTSNVVAYLEKIKGLTGEDVLAENVADANKFGLAKPKVKVQLAKEGRPVVAITVSAQNAAISFVRPTVYRITESDLQSLQKTAASFYDKKLPFQFEKDRLAKIEIGEAATKLSLKKEGSKWVLATPKSDKTLDSEKVDELIDRLSSLEVDRYLGQTSAVGIKPGQNEITLSSETGEKLLQFNWGEVYTEKGATGQDNEKLKFAKTNKVDQTLLVSDDKIAGLALDNLFQAAKPSEEKASAEQSEKR